MNFELSDEQVMLKDSITRYLRQHHSFAAHREGKDRDGGRRLIRDLAEQLGVLGVSYPEDVGGFGGGPVETMIVAEALGEAVAATSYLDTVVLAGSLLRQTRGDRAARLMRAVATGETIVSVGIGEHATRYEPASIRTEARPDGSGWRLTGEKSVVVGGGDAATHIVLASVKGELALFLVDRDAPGLTARCFALIDGREAADLVLNEVRVTGDARLGTGMEIEPLVERALDEAAAGLCAEAVGVLRRMFAETLEYAKQRKQFGQPLASFQVLQHRLVDMYMMLEQSVSATYLAVLNIDAAPLDRQKAVSAAKVTIARALRYVGQQSVQIHGGMGLTDLLPIGPLFKRATVMEQQFGSADYHIARYAGLARVA